MSPRSLPPTSTNQSLPSFAHTFPDIPRSSSSSTSSTPHPHHQPSDTNNNPATKKRRFEAIDASPSRLSSDPAHSSAGLPPPPPPPPPRFNRSAAIPPPPPLQPLRRPSRSNSRSSSASSSADGDDDDDDQDQILVKEEESENDVPPNPAPASRPHPRLQPPQSQSFPADSPTYIYPPLTPTGDDLVARKRRRVTISGGSSAHINHPHLTPSHLNGSAPGHSNVAISPLTPSTVSPVVMGFSVPRTPQGIPHKSSVDQVRSALSMKQQQKALIEARRTNPNASIPLPGSSNGPQAGAHPPPTPDSATDDRFVATPILPGLKRGRTRAVTVTTGTSSVGPQPGAGLGGRGEYVKESTMRSTLPSANEEPQSPAATSRPDSSRMDLDTPMPTPSRPSHPESPSVSMGAPPQPVSIQARRRPGSLLGVNTTGISSTPSSAANTTSSIPPSRGDESAGVGSFKRGPQLTVRTTALDKPPVSTARDQAAGPPPLVNASRPMDAPPQQPPASAQPATAKSPEKVPNISGARPIAIPRHPALTLDPVIRSAPLTVGGRMITSGRPPFPMLPPAENDRVPPVSQTQRTQPPVGRLVPASPTRPAPASPTAPKHHSQLFPPLTAQPPIRTPQVPISTTLRTPHVSQFTIPPRPGASGSAAATAGGLGQMTADKQSFLNLFGQFYDSLSDAKHLKTWLEGQVQKSDQLIASLQRTTKELEAERKRLRDDGPGEEVLRLRARVGELEERLSRLEGEPRARVVSPERGQRMDIDGSAGPSPVSARRPFEFPQSSAASHQFPPPPQQTSLPPLQLGTESGNSASGRLRSGSMNQHRPPPMPLPPIATLNGSGATEDLASAGGRNSSRRGSIVALPPPPTGRRSRRESMSSGHPNIPSPAPAGSFYASPSSNSISPPQRSSLVPLVHASHNGPTGRSPQPPNDTQSPHLPPPPPLSRASSKDRLPTRKSPMHLPPPSRSSPHQQAQSGTNGVHRGSPLPQSLAPQRRGSPFLPAIRSTGQQQIVAPTPTPSPPPRTPRLVDVGSRRDV